ncbi:MAG: PD40 domain-containing protein, partial [Planctomycetes bacterium]|nr:PD40 domain-containing protein [Planctomycetota bacterium]
FPSVSDDGNRVVFEQGFNIWRLDRAAGNIVPIELTVAEDLPPLGIEDLSYSSATAASLSEDGKMVALACQGDILVLRTEKGLPARRVVDDTSRDDDPVWLPGGEKLLFVSRRSGIEDLYTVHSTETGEPRLDRCLTTEVQRLPGPEGRRRSPLLDPAGKRIAFTQGDGDLAIQNLDGTEHKILHTGWSPPWYAWSPDGKWIAYSTLDNDFNSDVWLVPTDGTRAPFNLSANPRPDRSPAWSPDGRKLCFVSQRDEQGGDLWWLWLRNEDHEQTTEDRILKEDPPAKPEPEPTDEPSTDSSQDDPEPEDSTKEKEDDKKKKDDKKIEVQIDFAGIRTRFQRGFASENSIRSPIWGPDSKKIYFISSHETSAALYSLPLPGKGTAKKIASGSSPVLEWNAKSKKMLRIVSGTPTTVSATGTSTSLSFARNFPVDMAQRRVEVFDEAWATMRDRFYDPKLKGLDWKVLGDRYRPVAISRRNPVEFGLIINRMIGELNSSHQNFSAASRWSKTIRATAVPGWTLEVAPEGSHYRIASILPGTPAAAEELDLQIGDEIISIDQQPIAAGENLSIALTGKVGERVAFGIRRAGEDRTVVIRPISLNVQRRLLYEHWIRQRREQVTQLSEGRLGYLHIRGMNQSSLDRFAVELYEAGHGKEGLIIDVRQNGGGWTTDRMLASLTRAPHAFTVPRAGGAGYPNDRLVAPSWTRPIAVLCNQNSFSNAEIFSHAIKNLQRGPLIGVTTAGGVISTGSTSLLDGSSIRVPFRGWYTIPAGLDMELNGAIPDVVVKSLPADEEAGLDRQLKTAVEKLLEDLPPRRRVVF